MTKRFYHGTRRALKQGDVIAPDDSPERAGTPPHAYLTHDLDAAIWDAEAAAGDSPGRVYLVDPAGPVEDAPERKSAGHPSMSMRSRHPLRVTGEVTDWRHYHGTKADLRPGDLIAPGHATNNFARTLDAATWGAELAAGDAPGRVYVVEPMGPFEDDPNLTNKRSRGNPTKSFRSREPLRVTGEVRDWQGHAPESIKAMREGLARLEQLGIEPIED